MFVRFVWDVLCDGVCFVFVCLRVCVVRLMCGVCRVVLLCFCFFLSCVFVCGVVHAFA